jgi:hypothetical protein|tara:strand:- start:674 stop:1204 length:531 start_codon:yes stop_codon:yes gene_type:complete
MTKRNHDWYKLQKDSNLFHKAIPADIAVYNKLKDTNWKINFEHAHYALQDLLGVTSYKRNFDFAVITDIELSKQDLGDIVKVVKKLYDQSVYGVYVALLSYYIVPDKVRPQLAGTYSENLDTLLEEFFQFSSTQENISTVYDYPLQTRWIDGRLDEGANFIFVHPNIKYYLWKDNA